MDQAGYFVTIIGIASVFPTVAGVVPLRFSCLFFSPCYVLVYGSMTSVFRQVPAMTAQALQQTRVTANESNQELKSTLQL